MKNNKKINTVKRILDANVKQLALTITLTIALQSYAAENQSASQSITAQLPNIVLILADDMGYGDSGVYNQASKIPTPNLDAIAQSGIIFTDAHSPSAVCTPTRYGLLTGRYAWRTRLKKGVLYGESPALIEEGRMTIQSMLQDKGYTTAGIGKWHLGLGNNEKTDFSQALRPGPISSGFDYYFGIPASLDMAPYVYIENETVVQSATSKIKGGKSARIGGNGFWREGASAPDFKHIEVLPTLTKKAEAYLAERAKQPKQPFFLYMPLPSPHTPWVPKAQFHGKSQAGVYGDFVYQTDAVIGRINASLNQLGLAENTLFIITSDNGSHWKTSDIEKYDHLANGSWRGMKADIYEGGHRVPFIATWPKKISAASVSKQNLSLVDIMATLANIVGSKLPDNAAEDSYNLLPAFYGKSIEHTIREATIYHSFNGMFAIQKGPWKYIEGQTSGGFGTKQQLDKLLKDNPDLPEGQLYNLTTDPSESRNLFEQLPLKVTELKKLLNKYRQQGFSRPLQTTANQN